MDVRKEGIWLNFKVCYPVVSWTSREENSRLFKWRRVAAPLRGYCRRIGGVRGAGWVIIWLRNVKLGQSSSQWLIVQVIIPFRSIYRFHNWSWSVRSVVIILIRVSEVFELRSMEDIPPFPPRDQGKSHSEVSPPFRRAPGLNSPPTFTPLLAKTSPTPLVLWCNRIRKGRFGLPQHAVFLLRWREQWWQNPVVVLVYHILSL